MSINEPVTISITRFVLLGFAIKILIMMGIGTYGAYNENFEPGNISTPVSILAIGVGLIWYSKSVNRPMATKEIWRFALGTVIADLFLTALWVIVTTVISNQPLTPTGIDQAIFDGSEMLSNSSNLSALVIVAIFSSILTFGLAAFFAWLMTRKLPRP